MREKLEYLLKNDMRALALRTREDMNLTQDKMSEILFMSKRSYADIESGASACGALTVILLLMYLPNPSEFLLELKLEFDQLIEAEKVLL